MKFRLADGEKVRTVRVLKASATVIAAGDLVEIASGLAIVATASSATLCWCPNGGADGETVIEVAVGNDFTLVGTGDLVFAVTYKGGIYDINTTTQTIDYGASSIDALVVDISEDAGTVGTAAGVKVRINKPSF